MTACRNHIAHVGLVTIAATLALVAIGSAPAWADLNDGLIANWCFDACTANDCWDGFHGTNYGAACVAGVVGNAFEFTGTDIVRFIPSSWDNTISDAFTVGGWVEWYGPASHGRDSLIFDGRDDSWDHAGFWFGVTRSGQVLLHMNQSGSTIQSTSTVPADASPTHVAVVFDGPANLLRVYVNGTENAPVSTSAVYHDSDHQPAIGNNHWAPDDGQWATFNGVIDELRIYNQALNADDIWQLYQQGPVNQPPVADASGPYTGVVAEPVTFNASGSCDPDGTVDSYRWDWTCDGTWDTDWLSEPIATHTYDAEFHGQACLQVRDNQCAKAEDTADVDVSANQPPVCNAGGPYDGECEGATTAVWLDGSGSFDPDPQDSLTFAWTTDCPGGIFDDATSPRPVLTLATAGPYPLVCNVTLTVTDDGGLSDTCSATITVLDTVAPVVSCSVMTTVLWAPDHHLANVGLTTSASDDCDPTGAAESLLIEVWSDETEVPETGDGSGRHAPDAKDVDTGLRLRNERRGTGDGRVYLIIARAEDSSGNVGFGCCTVVVPHDQSQEGLDEVAAQAQAALAVVDATPGETIAQKVAPLVSQGWTQHGVSEELGPHQ